jgi:hypothetical protein
MEDIPLTGASPYDAPRHHGVQALWLQDAEASDAELCRTSGTWPYAMTRNAARPREEI